MDNPLWSQRHEPSFSSVVKAVEAVQRGNSSVKQLDLSRRGSFVELPKTFSNLKNPRRMP